MSVTANPVRRKKVAKTAWSYDDGGFDMNVDGAQWLGRVHQYLELPVHTGRGSAIAEPRVPYKATAAQCRLWAERIETAMSVFRVMTPSYIQAWCDFLKTCGGYDIT